MSWGEPVTQVKPNHDLNEQEEKFVHSIVELGMTTAAAWRNAGYSEKSVVDAYRKRERLTQVVNRRVQKRLVSHAPVALKALADIMDDKSAPASVRLKASTEWLDRSGYAKVVEMRITDGEKPINELTPEELEEKAAKILKKMDMRNGPRTQHISSDLIEDGVIVDE